MWRCRSSFCKFTKKKHPLLQCHQGTFCNAQSRALTSQKNCFNLLHWKPFKMMKNPFYFVLKVLFVLEIFKFLSWLFDCVEKRLDKKAQVNSKMYDATGYTTSNYNTCMSITSRNKGNQAMKFGQLIEYNTKNIFLQKSYTKCVEEASP